MALKRGHPLTSIPRFPSAIAGRLNLVSIWTAEEFVSQSIGDPEPMREFLALDARGLSDLVELAESVLDPKTVGEIYSFEPLERSHGALNPVANPILGLGP